MKALAEIFARLESGARPAREDIVRLLGISRKPDLDRLFKTAYGVKEDNAGKKVFLRGLVEISNICEKNCLYCGIRRGNSKAGRYLMKEDEVVAAAEFAMRNGYGSVVLQSGERTDTEFISYADRIIRRIARESDGRLGITLSFGEQTEETYARWLDCGAHRYLLRIETSSPELYASIHPPQNHLFRRRLDCLKTLGRIGYQVGTGVMIGLPGQTPDNLADDIIFFMDLDIDMVGMGPYIPHADTPLRKHARNFSPEKQLDLSLKMIAVLRCCMPDINIASTTALQSLRNDGRELGLLAGANVVMPNITAMEYRRKYLLYDNKPCIDDSPADCTACMKMRIESIGEELVLDTRGDSPHYRKRTGTSPGRN